MPITHTIAQGENLTIIAEKYGFISNWRAIYFHPSNAAFRKKRPNPMLVYPGDVINIPPPMCEVHPVQTCQVNRFELTIDDEDLIRKALRLHAEFVQLREDYIAWTTEIERSSWRMIAEWTAALMEQNPDDYASRINQPELKKFREDDRAQIQSRVTLYESKCRELVDLMNIKTFRKQFDALTPDEQDEVYSILVERLCECEVGRTYLGEAFSKEDSLLFKSVFKVTRKANTAFWRALGAMSPMIVLQKKSEAIEYIEKLILRKTSIDIAKLNIMRARWEIIPAGSIVAEHIRHEIPILKFDMKGNIKTVKGIAAKSLDLVNVAFALYYLHEKRNTREVINTVGAVTGLVDKFEKIAISLAETELAGLRMGVIYTKYSRVIGTNGAIKLLPKLATKLSILSLISGICETITGTMDAGDRLSKGDYNAAIAYGFVATGGLATAIGAGMMIFGGSTAWTGIGAIILVVGAIVSLIATICAWFMQDTPLQEWVHNNRFGKHLEVGLFGSVKKVIDAEIRKRHDYAGQLAELKKIITIVNFEADFEPGRHKITIKPNLVFPASKVILSVEWSYSDTFGFTFAMGTHMRDRVLDERFITQRDETRITELQITIYDSNHDFLYDKIEIKMQVDLYNDGQFVYERNAVLTPGVGERISSWF